MAITQQKGSLESLGFRKMSSEPRKRVVWLIAGDAKTGKSHLAFDAPGPLAYFNIDRGEEGTVEKFLDSDKEIWNYDVNITREMVSHKDHQLTMAKCEPMLVNTLQAYDNVLMGKEGSNIRSLIIDTWSEMFQLACLARIGKDKQIMPTERTKVNSIASSMIHSAFYYDKNVLLLAKTTEWEGVTKISGYNQSEGLAQATIMTGKKLVREGRETRTVFTYTIVDCRQNRDLMGEVFTSDDLGEHPFARLASMIVPNTKPSDWR